MLCSLGSQLPVWDYNTIKENLVSCLTAERGSLRLISLVVWEFWCACNRVIFRDHKHVLHLILARIRARLPFEGGSPSCHSLHRISFFKETLFNFPLGYFDDAAQNGLYGAGMVLKLSPDHLFHLQFRAGSGTNNRVGLLALWGLLWFSKRERVDLVHIFGDSPCIIDWVAGKSKLRPILLSQWLQRTRNLILQFENLSFLHIFRCHNALVDGLSKSALDSMDGHLWIKEICDSVVIIHYKLDFSQ